MSDDLPFWLGAGLLTALVVVALLRPLLRPAAPAAGRTPYDLAVYRDQLAEIARDTARGVLDPAESEAARLEIERRILAAAETPAPAAAGPGAAPGWLAAAIAIGLPALALAGYLGLGAPGLPGAPAADQPVAAAPPEADDMQALVEQLAQRMAANPGDAKGWLLLGRSYGSLGRYQDSATAYAAAIAHGAGDGVEGAQVHAAYGEALTAAADGQITAAARAAFDAAVASDPAEPRARFYLALAKAQEGRLDAALADWVALEAEAPADAPWRAAVTDQIERAAAALGLDPATLPGRASAAATGMPSPDEGDLAAAAEMTPEERDAFVRSMVERLAARLASAPDDLEGWLRLARAYGVLGDAEKAQDAWAHAAALAPTRVDVLLGYAQAIRDASVEEAPLAPEFADAVARARALDPENPLGLYLGGLAESAAGNAPAARALWQQLRDRLPEGSPERVEIEARLATLPDGS